MLLLLLLNLMFNKTKVPQIVEFSGIFSTDGSYTLYSFPLYSRLGFILSSSDLCMVEFWIDDGLGQGRHGPGLWDQAPRPPQACQPPQHHVCKEELVGGGGAGAGGEQEQVGWGGTV